jgi:hypothetical protein
LSIDSLSPLPYNGSWLSSHKGSRARRKHPWMLPSL